MYSGPQDNAHCTSLILWRSLMKTSMLDTEKAGGRGFILLSPLPSPPPTQSLNNFHIFVKCVIFISWINTVHWTQTVRFKVKKKLSGFSSSSWIYLLEKYQTYSFNITVSRYNGCLYLFQNIYVRLFKYFYTKNRCVWTKQYQRLYKYVCFSSSQIFLLFYFHYFFDLKLKTIKLLTL